MGIAIEEHQADQIFIPVENINVKEFLGLLDTISPVFVELTQKIVTYAEKELSVTLISYVFLGEPKNSIGFHMAFRNVASHCEPTKARLPVLTPSR